MRGADNCPWFCDFEYHCLALPFCFYFLLPYYHDPFMMSTINSKYLDSRPCSCFPESPVGGGGSEGTRMGPFPRGALARTHSPKKVVCGFPLYAQDHSPAA